MRNRRGSSGDLSDKKMATGHHSMDSADGIGGDGLDYDEQIEYMHNPHVSFDEEPSYRGIMDKYKLVEGAEIRQNIRHVPIKLLHLLKNGPQNTLGTFKDSPWYEIMRLAQDELDARAAHQRSFPNPTRDSRRDSNGRNKRDNSAGAPFRVGAKQTLDGVDTLTDDGIPNGIPTGSAWVKSEVNHPEPNLSVVSVDRDGGTAGTLDDKPEPEVESPRARGRTILKDPRQSIRAMTRNSRNWYMRRGMHRRDSSGASSNEDVPNKRSWRQGPDFTAAAVHNKRRNTLVHNTLPNETPNETEPPPGGVWMDDADGVGGDGMSLQEMDDLASNTQEMDDLASNNTARYTSRRNTLVREPQGNGSYSGRLSAALSDDLEHEEPPSGIGAAVWNTAKTIGHAVAHPLETAANVTNKFVKLWDDSGHIPAENDEDDKGPGSVPDGFTGNNRSGSRKIEDDLLRQGKSRLASLYARKGQHSGTLDRERQRSYSPRDGFVPRHKRSPAREYHLSQSYSKSRLPAWRGNVNTGGRRHKRSQKKKPRGKGSRSRNKQG